MPGSPPDSLTARRRLLELLVLEMQQTCRIILSTPLLDEASGLPDFILKDRRFARDLPLDINPRYPLNLDLEEDRESFLVDLSFRGSIRRCRIPWRSVHTMGVGPLLRVPWEHEDLEPRNKGPRKSRGHLSVVK